MKKLAFALAASAVLAGPAMAADMAAKAPRPMAAPVIATNWTGCYLSGGVGYQFDRVRHETWGGSAPNELRTQQSDSSLTGWYGTVGAGCDYQFNSRWVVGLFGDYTFSDDVRGDYLVRLTGPGDVTVGRLKNDWSWAIGGRLGYLVAPNVLTYVNGGYTQTHFKGIALYDRFVNNGGLYTGVGWSMAEPNRQFALVSPRHFVLPSHWGVTAGTQLRFLGSDGQLHTYTVDSTTQISENGTPTDLTLGRLTQTVPLADGVAPLPYLRFNNEFQYWNKALQVFGFNARVGAGTISAIGNVDLGNGTISRMYRFDYTVAAGGQDDCYFVTGDSGSPSCVIAPNGKAALTGTHTAVDTASGVTYSNYDTFVPHYVAQLNALTSAK